MPLIFGSHVASLGLPTPLIANPAVSILLPIAIGSAIGWSVSPKSTKSTYRTLNQPPLNPPAWLFGPVWTILYGLMGFSIHHAYTTTLTSPSIHTASSFLATSGLYTTQLALNFLWTPLFFGIERPELALVDILLLGGNLGLLCWNYFHLDPVAGWCTLPYIAWVSFATYLNAGVGILNGWEISSKRVKGQEEDARRRREVESKGL